MFKSTHQGAGHREVHVPLRESLNKTYSEASIKQSPLGNEQVVA